MDALTQLNTALAGRYQMEREIGSGGMAHVFLARDARHDRRVALKLLRPELGAVLGVERFLAEIKVTASLQHPNLLPLFDSGEANGLLFYVMPFVDGESLRARLNREKQLPVDEAVHIAVAIASALEYAHQHGVIHRDLKPENILMQSGEPLIADFGIALAVSNAGGARVTQTGISLGTPQYMSPEQATGDRAIDARTDIYSLGVMLYEMLAGDPPYLGSTAQAIIAKLLTERPSGVRSARSTVPTHVEAAISRALEKLPADRFATARELIDALDGRSLPRTTALPATDAKASTVGRWGVMAAACAGVGVASAALGWSIAQSRGSGTGEVARLSIALPLDAPFATSIEGPTIAISPDGASIVYTAATASGPQVAIRRLDELVPKAITGTNGGVYSLFSADGKSIAYFEGSTVKHAAVDGGLHGDFTPSIVAAGGGGSWAPNGSLVIAGTGRAAGQGLGVIRQIGDSIRRLTIPDTTRGELLHRFPHVLADGETVLFTSIPRAGPRSAHIGVASLRTGAYKVLADVEGVYPLGVIDGVLVYVAADGAIMGARYDARQQRVTGDRVVLERGVRVHGNGSVEAALAENGTLVYVGGSPENRLMVVDMQGNARPVLPNTRQFANPRFSPKGTRIAVNVIADGASEIWVYDLASKTPSRLTVSGGSSTRPEWSPDGRRILFRSNRTGRQAIWWQSADGSGNPEILLDFDLGVQEAVLGPDLASVVYRLQRPDTHMDLFVRHVGAGADKADRPLANSAFNEYMPAISPDGRWVAYVSNESGVADVYAIPITGSSPRVPVSVGGGAEPRWSPDGHRIYYRASRHMIAANVASVPTFGVSTRDTLFEDVFVTETFHAGYDVAPDGKHFLMLSSLDDSRHAIVAMHWGRQLGARMEARK